VAECRPFFHQRIAALPQYTFRDRSSLQRGHRTRLFPLGNISRLNLVTNQRYSQGQDEGTRIMADRRGLRIIGIIAASITAAVMLIAVVLVHKTVAGESALDTPEVTATVSR
jgi:hypothetical protein